MSAINNISEDKELAKLYEGKPKLVPYLSHAAREKMASKTNKNYKPQIAPNFVPPAPFFNPGFYGPMQMQMPPQMPGKMHPGQPLQRW